VTPFLAILNFTAISQAWAQGSFPLTKASRMAASKAGDTVSAAITLLFGGPYPKSPSWHLMTGTSSRSIAIPTSCGVTINLLTILKAAAQDISPSETPCLTASAISGFNLSSGERFLA